MKHRLLVTVLAITVAGLASPATSAAATYYVSTGGSDSNNGSQSSPFRTISRGIQATTSGDTLLVASGTYIGTFSPKSNTTIRANGSVILEGNGEIIFQMSGNSGVVIDGFVIDGSNNIPLYAFRFDNSSGNRIQNLEIRYIRHQSISVAAGANGNQFINLDIHHTGATNCYKPGGYCHGMYVSSDDNVMDGIRSHDNSGHGIQVYSDPDNNVGAPDRNIIRNSEAWGQHIGWGVYGGSANRIESSRAHHNEIGIRQGAVNTMLTSNVACENSDSNLLNLDSSVVLTGNLFGNPCPASTPPPAPTPSNLRIVSTQP